MTDRSNERLRLNHVRIGTADIERTVNWLFDEFGFASYQVMERPESGLTQWVTPLGRHVLEIFGIADRTKAGEQRNRLVAQGDVFLGWGVRTDDIDSVCKRLGLPASDLIEWTDPSGSSQWSLRFSGYEQMSNNPTLPYFLEYKERPELWPRHGITHRVEPESIAWVEVGGDHQTIRDWLGGAELGTADLPLRLSLGQPGVKAIGIETPSGISVLELGPARG